MSPTVSIALFGILPLGILLCGALSARPGILATFLVGWLFLPMAKLSVVGVPDYDKLVATNLAVLCGCLLFHSKQLFSVRLAWWDTPLVLWCLAPSFASLTNDLGAYDALSVAVRQALVWAIPYGIGRAYFNTAEAMRDAATALVIGGLVYMPLCLLEVRLSPQLHDWVYGFHQNQFWRNIRFDGYRPVVFMQSGLMVGTWMSTSTVVAFWSWVTGRERLYGMPWPLVVALLLVTTVLCKALYAILLMVLALGLLMTLRRFKTFVPLYLLLLCIPAYMVIRSSGVLPAERIAAAASPAFGEDRAQSLEARLLQEDALVEHVSERRLFGWGGWRRSWPRDPFTGEYELRGLDGLWTIVLGENGVYGLFTLFVMLLTPVLLVLARYEPADFNRAEYGATAALAISLLLFACDCLLNGMVNPFYIVIAGGLASLSVAADETVLQEVTRPRARTLPRQLAWRRPELSGSPSGGSSHG